MNRLFPTLAVTAARGDPRPDAALLSQFRSRRDEIAFTALVTRHAPAVRAACRVWLRNAADIDDAAQATFLILARRAETIRDGAAIGGWLLRVAENIARRIGKQSRLHVALPADLPARDLPLPDEVSNALAEEIARLPEKYRQPIQLCYLAGLTTTVAADRLGVPRNTVLTRLSRAREILRRRLTARGAAPVVVAVVATRGVAPGWVMATTRAALDFSVGVVPAGVGVERAVSAAGEIVQAMIWNKIKMAVATALVATAMVGFVVGQWASADGGPGPKAQVTQRLLSKDEKDKGQSLPAATPDTVPDAEANPTISKRRREAVIRMPAGTFVKEVDVPPYGHGRVTWNYEDDRVTGLIEASVMGVEIELETDAEISLSKNGTIYGVLNSAKLNHLRVPSGGELGKFQVYLQFLPAVEPLIAEMLTDLPFSYQCRLSGDRLVIQNFRALMAGPNPLGKAGAVVLGADGIMIGGFQAIGVAVEGTYKSADAKDTPKKSGSFKLKRTGVRPIDDE